MDRSTKLRRVNVRSIKCIIIPVIYLSLHISYVSVTSVINIVSLYIVYISLSQVYYISFISVIYTEVKLKRRAP